MASPSHHDTAKAVKILIADDHPLIRQIVTSTLNSHPRFDVIGEAENGLEALDKTRALKPDVVVLDISMPVLDGFEAARRIHECDPKVLIVILSTNESQLYIDEAKKIGVRAYVPKSEAADTLSKAIDAVIENDRFFIA
ncbi:MAG TPA: response regulator transcription factor [Candidatus Eremiobacteraceae bacterium]|nr:response regulator transcription factor [Candidatus Eremiobacteraceae bacterium]